MIAFLTLVYVAVLWLAVRLGLIRWTLWWKVSPLAWMLLLLVVLFLPMQWGAPSGPVTVYQYTIEIFPNVSGEVVSVPVRPLERVQQGEPLFTIDPEPFEAAVQDLEARLALARTRLRDAQQLATRGAGTEARVEKHQADVDSFEAQLVRARYDLDSTVVRAPRDGTVVALTLEPGQRVSNMPIRSWLAFTVDTRIPIVQIPQYVVRHVKPGQEVEVVLKAAPGQTLRGEVLAIVPSNAQGQLTPSGVLPLLEPAPAPQPFAVQIALDAEDLALLPGTPLGGSVGTAAIYTEASGATHVIRRVMIRMQTWLDFIVPT